MNAVTIKEAKEKLEELIKQTSDNAESPIICTDEGDKAVLVSIDEYNSLKETLYLLSNPANANHLMKSIAEAKSGEKNSCYGVQLPDFPSFAGLAHSVRQSVEP